MLDKMNCFENLPDLAFRGILQYLNHTDKLNLRESTIRLYRKTTQCDSSFKVWTFNVSKAVSGPLPHFILHSEKNFCLKVKEVSSDDHVQQIVHFFFQYSSRISSFDLTGTSSCRLHQQKLMNLLQSAQTLQSSPSSLASQSSLGSPSTKRSKRTLSSSQHLNSLKSFRLCRINYPFYFEHMQQFLKGSEDSLEKLILYHVDIRNCLQADSIKFIELKTLVLISCECDGQTLIHQLSPQLEHLRMYGMSNVNLNSIDTNDKAFTRLKSLDIAYCEIDINKILTRCRTSVRRIKLSFRKDFMFEILEHEFTNLKCLTFAGHEENAYNLIVKSATCLQRLSLELFNEIELPLTGIGNMKIRMLECNFRVGRIRNFDDFLGCCPLLQKLVIKGFFRVVNLQAQLMYHLRELSLQNCGFNCIQSLLQASRNTLQKLSLKQIDDKAYTCDFPVMYKIDQVYLEGNATLTNRSKDSVEYLFPRHNVQIDMISNKAARFSRIYDLNEDEA